MKKTLGKCCAASMTGLVAVASAAGAPRAEDRFSVLYTFEVADPSTGASPLGSQPDTRPALGPHDSVFGMTYTGGTNGNGVIYRYSLKTHSYHLMHTFGALDANGTNQDGANPGVALTRGPDDAFYGVAQYGGKNGTGTVFKITASGEFTVLHAFGALDSAAHNEDGANPLPSGSNFRVLHQFTPSEGHAASLTLSRDGFLYGCAVWPRPTLGSGILYRMAPSGSQFDVLHRFSAVNSVGDNADGAECFEPLIETERGVFYGSAFYGGSNGNGVVFRFDSSGGTHLQIIHTFSATNASGENWDGANPYARLAPGRDGWLYSTASYGGKFGDGVVYRLRHHGEFEVLHTFSAVDPTTGSNVDGADPDYGVVLDEDEDRLIGIADYGGMGSAAGATGNGTLYEIKLGHRRW
jgi:uncharacterized repeat protein (TIGR03803 family)